MSYSRQMSGLGTLPAGQAYGVGTRLVAGYSATGIPEGSAGTVPAALAAAMGQAFRGRIVSQGWGGGSNAFGVPSGNVFIEVEIAREGVTSSEMDGVFQAAGVGLQQRLGGRSAIRNTYSHVTRLVQPGGGAAAPTTQPGYPSKTPTAPQSTIPADWNASQQTMAQPTYEPGTTTGGVPVWALAIGGVAIVGVALVAVMAKPKKAAPAAVAANRRRRRR